MGVKVVDELSNDWFGEAGWIFVVDDIHHRYQIRSYFQSDRTILLHLVIVVIHKFEHIPHIHYYLLLSQQLISHILRNSRHDRAHLIHVHGHHTL